MFTHKRFYQRIYAAPLKSGHTQFVVSGFKGTPVVQHVNATGMPQLYLFGNDAEI